MFFAKDFVKRFHWMHTELWSSSSSIIAHYGRDYIWSYTDLEVCGSFFKDLNIKNKT